MKKLIFGIEGYNECMGSSTVAITTEETFQTEGCLDDHYPEEFYDTIHGKLRDAGIYELMESIYEYPDGQEKEVEAFLISLGMERSMALEAFLKSFEEDE